MILCVDRVYRMRFVCVGLESVYDLGPVQRINASSLPGRWVGNWSDLIDVISRTIITTEMMITTGN